MSACSGISSPAAFRVRVVPIRPQGMINGMNQLAFSLGEALARPLDEFPEDVKNYIDDVQLLATAIMSLSAQHGSNRFVRECLSHLDTHTTLVRFMRELPSKMQNLVQRIQRQWQPQSFTPSVLAYIQAVDKLMDDTERIFGQPGANHYVGEEIMRQLQHLQDEAIRGNVIPYHAHRRPDQGHGGRGRAD
jgi:hypothetical protein